MQNINNIKSISNVIISDEIKLTNANEQIKEGLINQKSAFVQAEFYEYVNFYAKVLNLVNLGAAFSLYSASPHIGMPGNIIPALKYTSVGLEGFSEALNGASIAINLVKMSKLNEESHLIRKEMKTLIKYLRENDLPLPDELIDIQAQLRVLDQQIAEGEVDAALDTLGIISRLLRIVATTVELFAVVPFVRVATSFITLAKAIVLWDRACKNFELHSKIETNFNHKYKVIGKEKPVDNKISQIQGRIILDPAKRANSEILSANSEILNEKKDLVIKLVNSKLSLEKNFIDLECMNSTLWMVFWMAAVAIGVGVIVCALTGSAALPVGILIGITAVSVVLSLYFLLAYYGAVGIYRPHYLKAYLISGLTTRLIRNSFFYNVKEWWMNGAELQKEFIGYKKRAASLTPEENEHFKVVKSQLEALEKAKKEWVDDVQKGIEEANWKDLVRQIKHEHEGITNEELSILQSILKDNQFDKATLDADLREIIAGMGNWKFLTTSDYVLSLQKQAAREQILLEENRRKQKM